GDLITNTQRQIDTLQIRTVEDVRTCSRRLVGLSSDLELERRAIKKFLYTNLYFSPALDPEKEDAERVISRLFNLWLDQPELLPSSYREQAQLEPLPRVICDYLAGMTDSYIHRKYEKHFGK